MFKLIWNNQKDHIIFTQNLKEMENILREIEKMTRGFELQPDGSGNYNDTYCFETENYEIEFKVVGRMENWNEYRYPAGFPGDPQCQVDPELDVEMEYIQIWDKNGDEIPIQKKYFSKLEECIFNYVTY